MAKVCEYYFAMQSPWSYLGHQRLIALAQEHGAQIDMKPVDLGKVFNVSGGLPLAKRPPQRQAYRLVEMKRWSERLGLPMNLQPKFFPVSGDPSAKLVIAAKLAHGTDAALALAGSIMQALWAEEKNIADGATLVALVNAAGHDGEALLKSSETASVQGEYDQFTNDAIAASMFGAPWYVVDGEAFWGQDRLDFVEQALQKQAAT